MRYAADDSLLGLEHAKRGTRARGGRRWTGTLSQRARASQRLPQAVFKISSYSRSAGAVWDRANYVARDGELEVEGPNGELVESHVELEHLVDTWSRDATERRGGVLAMSAVVSFPAGVDQEQATEAARQFFREAFADNHDYVFAPHTDAPHFHVHVVVQTQGQDGKQLRITKDDLQDLRMLLAEKAHEQGIELDASPRWARGLDAERRPSREVEGIERRGAMPGWTRAREGVEAPEAQQALAEERAGGRAPHAGESQALEYARAGGRLAAQIGRLESDDKKVAAVRGAASLAAFAWELTDSDREQAEAVEQTRAIVSQTERVIHDAIQGIEDGQAKQAAIRADRELAAHLREYRAAQREQAAQARAAERDSGAELEP